MKTLGDFLKEHNAGPGFRFRYELQSKDSYLEILFIGNERVFLVNREGTEFSLYLKKDDQDWQVYTPPKTFKEVKLLAWRHSISCEIEWYRCDWAPRGPRHWTRVPESDTVAKVEVGE